MISGKGVADQHGTQQDEHQLKCTVAPHDYYYDLGSKRAECTHFVKRLSQYATVL